ncbi:MAG: 2-oxo acid dehydrogenase subunit E2 [Acidobacteriota bacterium]|nr:2-oxo acid dehydrogenase subunit E2 [Acidobacteriota bacterium]
MADVTMPQLGETVADGTVTKWFKGVGDAVVKGEPLFEVSTDKVDTEIPAPADGTLTAILVPEGATVDVGTILATIGVAGDVNVAAPVRVSAATPAASSAKIEGAARPANPGARTDRGLSPVVRRLLDEHGLRAEQIQGTGPGGRLTRDDVLNYVANSSLEASDTAAVGSLSPVVRRLLDERGLRAADVVGTGPHGRLTRRDVEDASTPSSRRTASGDERVPFSKSRRLTAAHMVRSKATSAHTLMVREIDYEQIDVLRRRVGVAFKEREGFSLTYLPFVTVALARTLRDFPQLNASVGDDELILHHDLNIGIAVDLDNSGLVVPVIHGADRYSLVDVARKIRELALAARAKKLKLDDTERGTITISNPGPYGTLMTGAIINQPQVAILATDGVKRKPVVVTSPDGDESIAIHSVGLVALTFDHRAVDGAYAAQFLARLDQELNRRDWTLDD